MLTIIRNVLCGERPLQWGALAFDICVLAFFAALWFASPK